MPPKKILLVEDEQFVADLYVHVLTKNGFAVKHAPDGDTGLKMLEGESFDLLLLDIMLPGINGLELLKTWKLKNPSSKMLVLLLTNLGQDAVIKEGFELGASGYLIKSTLTPEQVVQEVKNALEGKISQGPPAPQVTQPQVQPATPATQPTPTQPQTPPAAPQPPTPDSTPKEG